MSVVRATEADLDNLRRLQQTARYRFADFGLEDLPRLISDSVSMVGLAEGVVWGFVSLQPEKRPATLPNGAPTRCYFRALILRSGYPTAEYVPLLLKSALPHLDTSGGPVQIVSYGGEAWIVGALRQAGFTVADQVQFYELRRPHLRLSQIPASTSAVTLRPADSESLGPLAELDAAAFPPLWHLGQKDMFELLVRCRMTMAIHEEGTRDEPEIVGYTAAVSNSNEELQLARIAVRPDVQRYGIGRKLLRDVVLYAAAERYERIILNTQTDNERSQALYRSCGFRPIGRPVPVLTKLVGAVAAESRPI